MDTKEALDRIWALNAAFHSSPDDKPSHVLLDPRLYSQLLNAAKDYILSINPPIDPHNQTVFHLPMLTVYKPYPFIALAKIAIDETQS